jgi:kynurenine formamidase
MLIDLTHAMSNGMAVWPGHPVFAQQAVSSIAAGDIACNHALHMSEHSGTHFDAPAHFIDGAMTMDTVPLDVFFGRLATLSPVVEPDGEVGPDAVLAFEAVHGPILPGDAVAFRFGWDRYFEAKSPLVYRDWPGVSGETAALLVARGVRIVATDAMSIDRFGSTSFPAHRTLLAAGVLIGENFANLGSLPPFCQLTALPLKIEGGSGAPLRAVAEID